LSRRTWIRCKQADRSVRSTQFDQLPKNRMPSFQFMFKPQHRLSNLQCLWSRQPYHANPPAPGWGCDGNDSVVEIHGPIVTVKLRDNQRPRFVH